MHVSQRNGGQLPEGAKHVLLYRVNLGSCGCIFSQGDWLDGGREGIVVEKVIPPGRQTPNYYAFLNSCEKSIFIF